VYRERLAWLVTLPVAVIGCEAAHALANVVLGSPTGEAGELFQGGGPGAGLGPLLASLSLVVVALALAGRAAGAWTTHRVVAARLPFALLAPVLFIVQEHVETALHTGAIPFDTVLEPTFLPGLVIQIPFALAGYAIARILIRLADGVRALVAGRRRALRVGGTRPHGRSAYQAPRRSGAHRWAHSGRAPPRIAPAQA
jgi:hypothetical protein